MKLIKDASGGVKAEEVYFTNKMENHHGGMIVYDGSVYGANGGNAGGFLLNLDLETGNVLWDERAGERRRARWPWPMAASTTAPKTARCS